MASLLLVSPLQAEGSSGSAKIRPVGALLDPPYATSTRRLRAIDLTDRANARRFKGVGKRPAMLIGSGTADEGFVMGFGLFKVPKVNSYDPNRANPMRDRNGKTTRTAAVGLSLSF